jgi:hypothetical protein
VEALSHILLESARRNVSDDDLRASVADVGLNDETTTTLVETFGEHQVGSITCSRFCQSRSLLSIIICLF